jgi:hypothetical protein
MSTGNYLYLEGKCLKFTISYLYTEEKKNPKITAVRITRKVFGFSGFRKKEEE